MKKTIFVGYDSPYPQAFAAAVRSVQRSLGHEKPGRNVAGLSLHDLIARRLYLRPTEQDERGLVDIISNCPMSTEFALSRFLVPHLAGQKGLALFMDCDMLVRGNIMDVFAMAKADPSKAVWVVKHQLSPTQEPGDNPTKMDGKRQTWYARKLWSSFMVFNLAHPSTQRLTLEYVNEARGLALHQFDWCADEEIGELPESWNWLVGMRPEPEGGALNVHWTGGGPWLPDPDFCGLPYEREWHETLTDFINDPGRVYRT